MKKLVSGLVVVGLLLVGTSAFAHPHTIERNGQVLANGASHPGFTEIEDGLFQSTGFDAYGKTNGGSANSAYGMETAHHGHDQGTPGKADDAYAAYGDTNGVVGTTTSGLIRPDDNNPAIQ